MFDIGFWEILLITIVALVVVGPERLPKLVRVVGLWVGRANSTVQSIRSEISRELRAEELKQALSETEDLSHINNVMNSESNKAKAEAQQRSAKTEIADDTPVEPTPDPDTSTTSESAKSVPPSNNESKTL